MFSYNMRFSTSAFSLFAVCLKITMESTERPCRGSKYFFTIFSNLYLNFTTKVHWSAKKSVNKKMNKNLYLIIQRIFERHEVKYYLFLFISARSDILKLMKIANYDELKNDIQASKTMPYLIGIDGRACSGKSTLAERLLADFGASEFNLDDLVIPFKEQPKDLKPNYPFPYFRYHLFLEGIKTLSMGKSYRYFPYDWEKDAISSNERVVEPKGFVVVHGVSTLNSDTLNCFHKKIFVVSDEKTEFEAVMIRDGRKFEKFWLNLWLPSEAKYMESKPWTRADLLYPARGVNSPEDVFNHLK